VIRPVFAAVPKPRAAGGQNPALLPCGIRFPRRSFDCAAGFPD